MLGSWHQYTSRFCAAKNTPWGRDVSGAANLTELHQHLKQVMVRRKKADVLSELPAKRRQRVLVELSGAQVDKLAELRCGRVGGRVDCRQE